ncbi:MAG: ATP-binding protein [Tepidisphaerales bacterium]
MISHFAPAERSSEDELRLEIAMVSKNPVVDALLNLAGGVLAVLNERRQIIAVNDGFLRWLGVKDAAKVIGLRPGEAVGCIYASECQGGCGTSPACSTCGAAIAIVSSLINGVSAEEDCALTVKHNGKPEDLFLHVRSTPVRFGGSRFVVLFLQDVTRQQHAAAIERVFFHDLANIVMSLETAGALLARDPRKNAEELAQPIRSLSQRLGRELRIQRRLTDPKGALQASLKDEVLITELFEELRLGFESHPAAEGRRLSLAPVAADLKLKTDLAMLLRVLGNMVVNALEATAAGDEVRVYVEPFKDGVRLCVWNRQEIAPEVTRRIFQRNFSTKRQAGRGLGTYSMKLFGEQYLGGTVDFETSAEGGTVFRLALPASALVRCS